MERKLEQELAKEREKIGLKAESESITSDKHPERNEDAVIGDISRLDAEIGNPPKLETDPNFAKQDVDTFRKWTELEKAAAPLLAERGVFGIFDGVSGASTKKGESKEPNGSGVLASRISSGIIADRLSKMRPEAGAEASAIAIRNAMIEANNAVLNLANERADLDNMATTADIIRIIESDDGGHELAYGHAGDSRIYVLDGDTKELRQVTSDDGPVADALHRGYITKEQHDMIMEGTSADDIPEYSNPNFPKAPPDMLRKLFSFRRRGVSNSIGASEKDFRVSSGTVKLKKGDRVFLSSDGVHDNKSNEEIRQMLADGLSAKEISRSARAVAESKGGKMDDVTSLLIEIGEGHGSGKTDKENDRTAEEWMEMSESIQMELMHLEGIKDAIDKGDELTEEDRDELGKIGGAKNLDKMIIQTKTAALSGEYGAVRAEMDRLLKLAGINAEREINTRWMEMEAELSGLENELLNRSRVSYYDPKEIASIRKELETLTEQLEAARKVKEVSDRLEVLNEKRQKLVAERNRMQENSDKDALQSAREAIK